MSQTLESFYGGAKHYSNVTSSVTLPLDSYALLSIDAQSGGSAQIPDLRTRNDWVSLKAAEWVILNVGSVSLAVSTATTPSAWTVAPGHALHLRLLDPSTDDWRGADHTVNSAVTALQSTYTASAGTTSKIIEPFCFSGTLCDWLKSMGNEALDGEGGRATVVAPLYQDVTVHAKNYWREAIRAADLVMPSKIAVAFEKDAFEVDSSHPLAGTTLSDEFYDALYNVLKGQRPHLLSYTAGLSGQSRTRHWHHCHWAGIDHASAGWSHGPGGADLQSWKYVWQALVPYGPATNPTAYTLDVRFIMEHTMSAVVPGVAVAGGPSGRDSYGAHGAICTLAVFTNELAPSFVDDFTTYQAAADSTARTYKRADPCVSGAAYNIGLTAAERMVHPQAVIIAHIPTTFEAPCRRNWVAPDINTETYQIFKGDHTGPARNLGRLYDVPNGSPWLDLSGCTLTYPGADSRGDTWPDSAHGVLFNVVFGWTTDGIWGRGMTLGGDIPRSELPNWLVFPIEDGLTYLKALKPGWNATCGYFDVSGGSSAAIYICTADGNCTDCEDSVWPSTTSTLASMMRTKCDGHPAEPFEDIGGTHHCFRNAGGQQGKAYSPTTCCIPIVSTVAKQSEYCVRIETPLGDPLGDGTCVTLSDKYTLIATYWTQWAMPVWDYFYNANGNQGARILTWNRWLPDPRKPFRNYTYDQSDFADFSSPVGAASNGATYIDLSSPTGSTTAVRSYTSYGPTPGGASWDWFGAQLEATTRDTLVKGHGLGFLRLISGADSTGVGLYVYSPSASTLNVQLVEYVAGVRKVLATQTVSSVSNGVGDMLFKVHGTSLVGEFTPTGKPKVHLEAESGVSFNFGDSALAFTGISDCANKPSLYTEETTLSGSDVGFKDLVITDIVPAFSQAYGWTAYSGASFVADAEMTSYYGYCEEIVGEGVCGECCSADCQCINCNCSIYTNVKLTALSMSHTSVPPLDIDLKATPAGCSFVDLPTGTIPWTADNPTYLGGPDPYRAYCRGTICNSGVSVCAEIYPAVQGKPYLEFALPLDPEFWDISLDPDCLTDIPLICRGLTLYNAAPRVCL